MPKPESCFQTYRSGKILFTTFKALSDLNLWQRSIKVSNPHRIDEFRWISLKSEYLKGGCQVGFSFSSEVLPYLQQLKQQFTKYKLGDISDLKTIYSIRLFEMLMQFQATGLNSCGFGKF